MQRWIARAAVALLLALVLPSTVAFAHERRDVGKYQFVVGFAEEPALLNQPNAASVRITNKETNQPVEDAQQSLELSIASGGGQPKKFPLRAQFGQPGTYVADFIPTRTGDYIFTFTGTLDGQPIDERFESGPGRFDEVKPLDELQFPETVPSTVELARQLREAQTNAQQAQTFAYVGAGLGLLGVLVGLVALLRRPAAPVSTSRPSAG